MEKLNYKVLGVMSGTSLDGIDLAIVDFRLSEKWSFKVLSAETISYPIQWKRRLQQAILLSPMELRGLDEDFTQLLAEVILRFKKKYPMETAGLDAVCSHGHTVKHEPQNGFTLQIGNLPKLSQLINETLVCNFRVQDVDLGGQGAPLVPIGDELLFTDFDFCLNLGGFANISTKTGGERVAFDVCPVNTVLNFYAEKLGKDFDEGGEMAARGNLNEELLRKLNQLDFYFQKTPKSLGIEWVNTHVFPLLKQFEDDIPSILHTFTLHIAVQISKSIGYAEKRKVMVTGGGAFNNFLIRKIKEKSSAAIFVPQKELVEFKEAIIFGFLGVLKLRNEVNVLKSVTGAVKNHSSGKVYLPKQ